MLNICLDTCVVQFISGKCMYVVFLRELLVVLCAFVVHSAGIKDGGCGRTS